MANPKLSADFQKSFDVFRRVLKEMSQVINVLIGGIVEYPVPRPLLVKCFSKRPATKRVLIAMLQAIGSSSDTLLRLSDEPGFQSRDCFSISRSIVELAVNICYICAEGDAVANQAERHSQQKAFRDLDRKSNIRDQTIRIQFLKEGELEIPEELAKNIKEFTSKSGREKDWTDLSINARCERIDRVFGKKVLTPLHWARFAVYRHSSEILHGTFFSAVYFMGLTQSKGPPETVDEFLKHIASNHLMVIMAAAVSLGAVTKAVSAMTNFPELEKLGNDILKNLETAPFMNRSDKPENSTK